MGEKVSLYKVRTNIGNNIYITGVSFGDVEGKFRVSYRDDIDIITLIQEKII